MSTNDEEALFTPARRTHPGVRRTAAATAAACAVAAACSPQQAPEPPPSPARDDFDTVGHPASGEIDVTEVLGHEPNVSWASVHGPGYVRAGLTKGFKLPSEAALSEDFHTYAVEWINSELKFSLDGREFYVVGRGDIGQDHEWVFDKPFFLLLNLAVGGEWPGAPDDSALPSQLVVDSVRVFGKP